MAIVLWIVLALLALIAGFLAVNAAKTRKLAANALAAVPPLGQFITVSTGRLHYIDRGEGPTIVLIHGLGGQLRHFTLALVDLLTPHFRVVAIDRPGMGYSERPASASASLDAQAGYVLEVIDALKLDRPLIVGHSLGGAIALALALRAPDKIRGLALLAPFTQSFSDESDALRPLEVRSRWLRRLLSLTVAAPLTLKMQAQTTYTVFGPDPIPKGYAVAGGGLLILTPEAYYNASTDFVEAVDSMAGQELRYPELSVPTSILFGSEDRLLDHRLQGLDLAAKYPAIKIELIDGAGHMLPTNHPDRCAAFIREVDAGL